MTMPQKKKIQKQNRQTSLPKPLMAVADEYCYAMSEDFCVLVANGVRSELVQKMGETTFNQRFRHYMEREENTTLQ